MGNGGGGRFGEGVGGGRSHFLLRSAVPSTILRAKDCGLVGSSRTQRDCKLEGSGETPKAALRSVCRDTGLGWKNEEGQPPPTGASCVTERPLGPVTRPGAWQGRRERPQPTRSPGGRYIDRAQRGHSPAQACTARQWHHLACSWALVPIRGPSCTLTSRLRLSRQEEWPPGAHTAGWTRAEREAGGPPPLSILSPLAVSAAGRGLTCCHGCHLPWQQARAVT